VEVEVEVAPFFVFGLGVGTTKTKDERTGEEDRAGQGRGVEGRSAFGWAVGAGVVPGGDGRHAVCARSFSWGIWVMRSLLVGFGPLPGSWAGAWWLVGWIWLMGRGLVEQGFGWLFGVVIFGCSGATV
jgi:hypothetical protein